MNLKNPNIAIIIPVFNRKYHLYNCIEYLKLNEYKQYTIVVIDDGSTDGTGEFISVNYPEIVVLKGDGNLWWSGSVNKGICYAIEHNFDYVLTYNDDQICDKYFLKELVNHSSEDTILSSLILYLNQPDMVVSSGILFNKTNAATASVCNEKCKTEAGQIIFEVDILPGYSVLIPIVLLAKTGLFNDKDFPQINMEVEFCLRVKAKGFHLKTVPTSMVWNDREDKTEDPVVFLNPWKRFWWFTTSFKSDLNYQQALNIKRILIQYADVQAFTFNVKFWIKYLIKLTFKVIFTKRNRKKLHKIFNTYNNSWA